MPQDRQDLLYKSFRKGMDEPKFKDLSNKYMVECNPIERDQFKKVIYDNYDKFGKIVQGMGIQKK